MGEHQSFVKLSAEKRIPKSDLLILLRTYNCYHEGNNFQLRAHEEFPLVCTSRLLSGQLYMCVRGQPTVVMMCPSYLSPKETDSRFCLILGKSPTFPSYGDLRMVANIREEGGLILEGLLNIHWGLHRPIRLQMHDDNERLRLNRNKIATQRTTESNNNSLRRENGPEGGSMEGVQEEEESPQLLRTRSDASFMYVQRRSRTNTARDLQRLRTHRFSINGHFYNHKTSVFTPAFGSVTNVRVNSAMTTVQVLNMLLQKFRVENKSEEFVLYMVHTSGERTQLRESEYPLVTRVLHGPCEMISKIFIMETDLGEEVTYDVAQYIKFETPVLDSFVEKLKEEEEREINKLTKKYIALRSMIVDQLERKTHSCDPI